MFKLASHNSGTGERSRRWWHRLVVPFARCQSVTVIQQYNRGVRYFDFRVREKNGVWCFAHGLWESASDPWLVLALLDNYARVNDTEVFISFTYEGKMDERGKKDFLEMVEKQCIKCPAIKHVQCVVRKPSWELLAAWEPQQ
ncbi:MAG: hypothetical protein Q4A15_08575, partial [Prevotellaceae bacterium]|nr:hypothetical protein [Prevotellaceae bacterium]